MPNQDALTLAKVAIEASNEFRHNPDNHHFMALAVNHEGSRREYAEKHRAFVAAAIDRHMERVSAESKILPGAHILAYHITKEPLDGNDVKNR